MPPFEAELIRVLGETRYPGEFDARARRDPAARARTTGSSGRSTPATSAPTTRTWPSSCRAIPGHADGHELACVADLSPDNIRPLVRREVQAALEAEMQVADAR